MRNNYTKVYCIHQKGVENRMKLKRIFSIIFFILIIGTCLSGCQKNKAGDDKQQGKASSVPAKIDFWADRTLDEGDIMKKLVEKYNKEQDKVKVEFMSMPWNSLSAKVLEGVKDGKLPDVLGLRSFEIGKFAQMGALDFNNTEKVKVNKEDYADNIWKAASYKEKQFAIPLGVDMQGIFYNKETLDKVGLKEAPSTGTDLISMAQKLTVDKNGKHPNEGGFDENDVIQYGLGINMDYTIFQQFYTLYNQQAGANQFTESMTKLEDIDDEKAANAFQFIEDLIFKYKVVPKNEKSSVDDFKSGKVAMFVGKSSDILLLESSNIKWETFAYPKIFDKSTAGGITQVLALTLKKNSDDSQKEAVADFTKWLCENSGELAKAGLIPANKKALEDVKNLQGRRGFIEGMDRIVLVPPNPKITQVISSTDFNSILSSTVESVASNKNSKEIVTQLKKGVDAVLSK